MKKFNIFVAGLAGLVMQPVQADETNVMFGMRAGPSIGNYSIKQSITGIDGQTGSRIEIRDSGGVVQSFEVDDSSSFLYGLQAAPWVNYGKWFGEVAIDLMSFKYDDRSGDEVKTDRTDIVSSVGYLLGAHGTAFVGYRWGLQGDSFFNDDFFSEQGWVFGAGLSGLPAGDIKVSASAAYNLSDVKGFSLSGDKFGYDGLSLKLSVVLTSLPQHMIQLRYQRFEGSDSLNVIDLNGNGAPDKIRSKLEESYLQLTYQYTFVF